MEKFLLILVLAAMVGVVFVLARGISGFGKGGVESGRQSNRMMQWRIGLQFVAVILILVFVMIAGSGG